MDHHQHRAAVHYVIASHIVCGSDMVHTQDSDISRLLSRHTTDYVDLLHLEVSQAACKQRFQHADHCRLFYWFGARYDLPLLVQASIMVVVQLVLLHVALLYRGPVGAQHSLIKPFAGAHEGDSFVTRPFHFWQWRSRRPYWQFIGYYTLVLALLQYFMGPQDSYIQIQGYVALSIEAILPIPQILQNARAKSCRGFRLSVLINWLVGDAFKLSYFYLSDGAVPLAFKLCGLFQTGCDIYLGIQYYMYGDGPREVLVDEKDPRAA